MDMDKLFDLASRWVTSAKTSSRASLSRRTVALLSVFGLAFSTLLAVVPLSTPAVEQGGQVLLPLLFRVFRVMSRARRVALIKVTAKLPGGLIFGRLVLLLVLGGLRSRCGLRFCRIRSTP